MSEQDDLTGGLKVVPGVDFPLPPADLADRLDNSGDDRPAAAALPEAKAVVLDYIDEHPHVVVPLKWPFRLDGEIVRSITVRALPVFETGEILRKAGGNVDSYAFYAAMTGLPADVVRALPGDDGERVTTAAYDFLPHYLKGASGA